MKTEEIASDLVKKYVRFEDHSQYIAGDPATLKKDIIKLVEEVAESARADGYKEGYEEGEKQGSTEAGLILGENML